MKSSLVSAGVSLVIIRSIPEWLSRLPTSTSLRYATEAAESGVMSIANALACVPLPNFSASCALAALSAISCSTVLIGASGPRCR